VKASYPDCDVTLVKGGGGIFDVKCDGKLVYSKHKTTGQRFPDAGEISKLISREKG